MEKITFTIRFIILIIALPAIMLVEMTRSEKPAQKKPEKIENIVASRLAEPGGLKNPKV